MAVTTYGIDRSTWTLVYEAGRPTRQLPWALMHFGDAGEEGTRFVVPLPPSSSIEADLGDLAIPSGVPRVSGRIGAPDYAPFSPFPYEGARRPLTSGALDSDKSGPVGIHFFGGI